MHILNLISVAFWLVITYQSFKTFMALRDQGLSRREVTAITILLLCGLNITRGTISFFVDIPPVFTGQLLLEYFYIGSSVFQLLLCNIVLNYIQQNEKSNQ